jgi:ABC-type amino acid transport system permease subunit
MSRVFQPEVMARFVAFYAMQASFIAKTVRMWGWIFL